MAVMAPGAAAPIEMLCNLWEMEVRADVPSTPGGCMSGTQFVDRVLSRRSKTFGGLCALCSFFRACCMSISSCTPLVCTLQGLVSHDTMTSLTLRVDPVVYHCGG